MWRFCLSADAKETRGNFYFVQGPIADVLAQNYRVEKQEKKKTPKGRAKKRLTYTRRFVNVTLTGGKRKVRGPQR